MFRAQTAVNIFNFSCVGIINVSRLVSVQVLSLSERRPTGAGFIGRKVSKKALLQYSQLCPVTIGKVFIALVIKSPTKFGCVISPVMSPESPAGLREIGPAQKRT